MNNNQDEKKKKGNERKSVIGSQKNKICLKQTLANTSTWYRYSSKICQFINYLCMNLCKKTEVLTSTTI